MSTLKELTLAAIWWSVTVLPRFAIAQQADVAPVASTATDTSGCVEPARMLSVSDFDGPFQKVAALLSHRIELKTVHKPYSGKGPPICGLDARQKFAVFVRDISDPLTFLTAGFNAGWAQANNDDSSYGPGATGYGQRLGAALAGSVSGSFFGTFFYPSLLKEDPRYYRQLHGGTKQRLVHALTHVAIARADSGSRMFNCSEWLSAASSSALDNVYHPGNRRGFGPAATRAGINVATDMGTDVLREFWPQIARTLRVPFLRSRHARVSKKRSTAVGTGK